MRKQDNRKKFAAIHEILLDRRSVIMERNYTLLHELREKNPACDGLRDGPDDPRVSLEIAGQDKIELQRIDAAIADIEKGTYGKCGSCGSDITLARLMAVPFAQECRSCKKAEEDALSVPVARMTPFATLRGRIIA